MGIRISRFRRERRTWLAHSDRRLRVRLGDELLGNQLWFDEGQFGHFEISLIRRRSSHYDIEIFMRLRFVFVDGDPTLPKWPTKRSHKWTNVQKRIFFNAWHRRMKRFWDAKGIGNLKDGKPANISFRFRSGEYGPSEEHFDVSVTKIPRRGPVQVSTVGHDWLEADVELDSGDFRKKWSGQKGAFHEFGHMIGLPDEYIPGTASFISDPLSIMNVGMEIRRRHRQPFIDWANAQF